LQADSRPVHSNQRHVHSKLPLLIHRSISNLYQRPISSHSRKAFEQLQRRLAAKPLPLVLDSFCGTGHSTCVLAQRHPNHLVVGIDKSSNRLSKHSGSEDENYILLQAQCEDIWRLLRNSELTTEFHYLLYPNPWPKSSHLQRRVHGHPTFHTLLELGGRIELRSNWQVYVEEFGIAMNLCGVPGTVVQIVPDQPITLFERKYLSSGHSLWAFIASLKASNKAQ
jgi:tRNA (guanine-N7-)-methyltransferase